MAHICRTQLKQTLMIAIPAVIVALGLIAGIVYFLTRPVEVAALTDPLETAGIPEALPEEYGYTFYMPQGYNAAAQVCGNPKIDGRDVYLYLTNPIQNPCQMRAEVFTVKAGRILSRQPAVSAVKLQYNTLTLDMQFPIFFLLNLNFSSK